MILMILATALAPIIWGSTYYIATEFLPTNQPFLSAAIRCVPAGIFLLLIFWEKVNLLTLKRLLLLSVLNISLFQSMLFISAYKLPGGVAALLTSIQPAIIIFIAYIFKGEKVKNKTKILVLTSFVGMCLIFIKPSIEWNIIGILAALTGAISMSFGTFLSREWSSKINIFAFTGYQLLFGGLVLLLLSPLYDEYPDSIDIINLYGYAYLILPGAIISYSLWFNGIKRLPVNVVAPLGFMSPVSAIIIGWIALDQSITLIQSVGIIIVLLSLYKIVLKN